MVKQGAVDVILNNVDTEATSDGGYLFPAAIGHQRAGRVIKVRRAYQGRNALVAADVLEMLGINPVTISV
ncbi:hypothetical protein D3C76_1669310 [compost metagenome]